MNCVYFIIVIDHILYFTIKMYPTDVVLMHDFV